MTPGGLNRIPCLLLAAFLALLAAPVQPAHAGQCPGEAAPDRPRIGLVLGGGGARGGAHIGVLKFLEEQRIPVDVIAGTSMGAIIGGLYAAGMGAKEIERVLVGADWADLFKDTAERRTRTLRRKADDDLGLYGPKLGIGEGASLLPGGALAGQKVGLLLERLVSERTSATRFDELPIPFRAVAADLVTGDMVVLQEGSLSYAMRASMSVPGVFDPAPHGSSLLVDGGVVRNLPVDVARGMGADVVIAVNVEYPKLGADQLRDLVSVVSQLTTLMIARNTEEQIASLGQGDILIQPQLGTEIGSADFERVKEIVPLGYEASEMVAGRLTRLSLGEDAYHSWRRGIDACVTGLPVVQFVRLDNRSRFADEVIEELVSVQPGNTLDQEQLERDLELIHGLGFIRQARYSVIEEDGRQGLLIEVEEDARGTRFIETGLSLTGDGRGTEVDLQLGYLRTDLSDYGAEFRGAVQLGSNFGLLAQIYAPLDKRLRWVVQPWASATRRSILAFGDNGTPLADLELDELTASLAFGREFGRHAGLFAAVTSYTGDIKVQIGEPLPGDYRFDGGEWSVWAIYDRLDDRFLPSSGTYARLAYTNSSESLGADAEFEQVKFSAFTAHSWGPHTAWLSTTFNSTLDDDAPVYGLFTGGGFLNMSGFERDELIGQHFGYSMLGYRYRLGQAGFLPGYAGMTLEYGNAALSARDVYGEGILNGSLYLAFDSPLGPLYFGYGWSEEQSGLLFLRLGTILAGEAVGRR
jgi:NTE family protein